MLSSVRAKGQQLGRTAGRNFFPDIRQGGQNQESAGLREFMNPLGRKGGRATSVFCQGNRPGERGKNRPALGGGETRKTTSASAIHTMTGRGRDRSRYLNISGI